MNSTNEKRTFEYYLIFCFIVLPPLLDFIFYQTKVARVIRITLVAIALFRILLNSKNETIFVKPNLNIMLLNFLIIQGTIGDLAHGAAITPIFLNIIVFSILVNSKAVIQAKLNIAELLYECASYLVLLSFLVILFAINLRNEYSPEIGYFIPFNGIIGIPGRQFGIFPAPNALAQIAGFVFIYSLLTKKSLVLKTISIFCVLETGSRTSLVIVLFISGLIFILKRKGIELFQRSTAEYQRSFAEIISIQSLMVLTYILLGYFFLKIESLDSRTFNNRVLVWKKSLEFLLQNPFFGKGWSWYEMAISQGGLPIWAVNAHNSLLEILFATGLFGVTIFFAIIYAFMFSNTLNLNKILLLYILLSGVTESNLQFVYADFFTFALVALLIEKDKNGT